MILTNRVSDAHLAGLRQDGVSYIFAGEQQLDLALALEILNRELGLERLLLEGGGGSNGAFLRAGLIDEISVAICPTVDGAKSAPSIFDSGDDNAAGAAPVRAMTLIQLARCWKAVRCGCATGCRTADAGRAARQGQPFEHGGIRMNRRIAPSMLLGHLCGTPGPKVDSKDPVPPQIINFAVSADDSIEVRIWMTSSDICGDQPW